MHPDLQIHIIDDDYISNIITETILRHLDITHQIRSYVNPQEALTSLEKFYRQPTLPPRNLIFLDIYMPLMDGAEFLDAFQAFALDVPTETGVVLLSGSENPDHAVRFSRYPIVKAQLLKPLTEEAIRQLLAKLNWYQP